MSNDWRSKNEPGTYEVRCSKALLEELRAEIADLYARLMSVDHTAGRDIERDPAFLVGGAQEATGHLLDILEGRKESYAASRARHRKMLRAMEGR